MSAPNPTPNAATELADSLATQAVDGEVRWERRSGDRHPVSHRAFLRRHGASECTVDLVDLSEDGAGVWSTTQLVPGEVVDLVLPRRRADRLVVEAVVADRRSISPNAWRLSLQFLQRLRPDDLASALD
jgi:hypothetical protein